MDPTRLSRELRLGHSDDLERRRWAFGLSLFGAAIGGVVGAYQLGLIRRLPDPPLGPFDSEKVDASDYAYKRMDTPDGALMLLTYSVTAVLAAAGGQDRARTRPWLPIALAAKSAYDSATALQLAREEWDENSALCAYCQAATVTTLLTTALTLPEAGRAAQELLEAA
jgi:hypothetical protein